MCRDGGGVGDLAEGMHKYANIQSFRAPFDLFLHLIFIVMASRIQRSLLMGGAIMAKCQKIVHVMCIMPLKAGMQCIAPRFLGLDPCLDLLLGFFGKAKCK